MEELLQPLSYWGALFGLVPSWNVFNSVPKQQKFCRPLFWWCLLVFFLQIADGARQIYNNCFSYKNGSFGSFPTAFVVFAFVITGLYTTFNLIPRLFFIHEKKLSITSKKIKQFDFMFNELEEDFEKGKLRRRLKQTLPFGVIWVILAAFGIIFPSIHTTAGELSSAHQLAQFVFLQLVQVICFIHGVVAFLVFYMTNTIIAIRIKVIIKAFQNLVPTYGGFDTQKGWKTQAVLKSEVQSKNSFEDLDRIRKGFHTLYEASNSFNEACSVAILLSLFCKLFMCSISLFILIYTFITWPSYNATQLITFSLVMFLSDLSCFLIVLSSANKPVTQCRNLLMIVSQSRTVNLREEEKAEILVFGQQIQNSSFSLSVAGMFHVGAHLIPGICASVLTYIIVMLQSTTQNPTPP